MKIVLDTNVIISAILSNGPPSIVTDMIGNGRLTPFINDLIIKEYLDVINRPKFNFSNKQIYSLLNSITKFGVSVESNISSIVKLPHEDDRKFYDLAKTTNAYLITGNLKHYPNESFIISPADFLKIIN
ncbi:MAG: putative toxin-antitoxin system toxin component, PIN family [Treponema sp.]|nr:putative toxin-antitoxin system toxin component, PIN family [Treponema sp.]